MKPAPTISYNRGLFYVVLSAVFFSIAGVLIKYVPWNPISINGARCLFAIAIMYAYLRSTGRRFHVNKQILWGAALNFLLLETFVAANKFTTAANAIVLQFITPVWVIVLCWVFFKIRPRRSALIACGVVLVGIVLFFVDDLSFGNILGNVLAIISGIAYAGVFLLKKAPECDFECAAILGFIACFAVGIPFYLHETVLTPQIFLALAALGIVQLGLAFLFLSKGLDVVSPVTAALTSTIEPVLNPILVAVTIGEVIGPLSIFSAVLVIGASTVYNIYSEKRGQDGEENPGDPE